MQIMREQKRILELTDFEWWLLINCLNEARTLFINESKPTGNVDELPIKIFKAKWKKVKI